MKKIVDYNLENIVSLYENGMSCREIGKLYGVAGSSIHTFLKKNDIPIRSRSSAAKIRTYDDGICAGRGEEFRRNQPTHEICSDCIPSLKWRIRWQKYRITKKDYDRIVKEQGGVCPLCLEPLIEEKSVVDHCHATGKVRGILCDRDNKALGMFENPVFVARAFSYLRGDSSGPMSSSGR